VVVVRDVGEDEKGKRRGKRKEEIENWNNF
jgi:hypothetical protein